MQFTNTTEQYILICLYQAPGLIFKIGADQKGADQANTFLLRNDAVLARYSTSISGGRSLQLYQFLGPGFPKEEDHLSMYLQRSSAMRAKSNTSAIDSSSLLEQQRLLLV
jgi:hypothetical protein